VRRFNTLQLIGAMLTGAAIFGFINDMSLWGAPMVFGFIATGVGVTIEEESK